MKPTALPRPILAVCAMLLISFFTLSAAGSSETETPEIPVPEGPEIPSLPSVLRNSDDFEPVLESYQRLIDEMDPLIESMLVHGLEMNKPPLEKLRTVIEWWRDYIVSLKIQAENPKLGADDINDFLGRLVGLDQQFSQKLDQLNELIRIENGEEEIP